MIEKVSADRVRIPAGVPTRRRDTYLENWLKLTHNTGRLMLFAGDQKVEHLHDDFAAPDAHPDDADPIHLFRIASQGRIGVFATQLGLIARYAAEFPNVSYMVKLNSKSHLVKTDQRDPYSAPWFDADQVAAFRDESGLPIRAVGFTVYLGSEYEGEMLRHAAQSILAAHRHGLVTCLWMYPRGKSVKDERDPHLIAGAAGVAATLGSDFCKVNPPKEGGKVANHLLTEAVKAAGRTGLICAGGSSVSPESFLKDLAEQLAAGAVGNATGRNIHQRSLEDAVRLTRAISALTLDAAPLEMAQEIWKGGAVPA